MRNISPCAAAARAAQRVITSVWRCLRTVLLLSLAAPVLATSNQGPPAPGRLVDVGGHRLYIHCTGEGAPTVVIDGGAGTWSAHYSRIQAQLSRATKVCTYDRAGLGSSDAGPRPRNSLQMVDELHRLLHAAGIAPPVVLVGHSLGGYNVRIYQAQYPEEIAGLVLVDSAHEGQWERLPREVRQLVAGSPSMIRARADQARQRQLAPQDVETDVSTVLPPQVRDEYRSAWLTAKPYDGLADEVEAAFESARQVRSRHSLGALPLVVLTARNSYAAFEGIGIPVAAANRVWLELQGELASLSRRSTHLFSERDHNLQVSDPGSVIAAIRGCVDLVRAEQPAVPSALGLAAATLPLRSTPDVDRLLERLESAYNARDAEAFVDLFTDDVVQLDVNRRVHVKGRTAWLDWTRRINAAHGEMTRRHRGRARVGDWVVAEIEWSGTVAGAAIGRTYRYTGLGLLRMHSGKVAQQILYGDYASLVEQLGGGDAASEPAPAAQASQQAGSLPEWVQADWEYYTQGAGKWIADNGAYQNEDEPWEAYRLEWSWGPGKKTLKGRLLAMKDGKDVGVIYEYLSYWHPAQRRVVLNQWGSDGTYGTGTMTASGERTTESRQSFFGPDGGGFQVMHRAEKLEGEARLQSFRLSTEGVWEQGRRYVWKALRP